MLVKFECKIAEGSFNAAFAPDAKMHGERQGELTRKIFFDAGSFTKSNGDLFLKPPANIEYY